VAKEFLAQVQLILETVEETTHGVVLRVRAKHLPRYHLVVS
jgi:hypothetical protein